MVVYSTDDLCNVTTGACYFVNNALPCDDFDTCTIGDTCSNGQCQAGATPRVCDDGNPWSVDSRCAHCGTSHCVRLLTFVFVSSTTDTCHQINGCTYTPDDQLACSLNDVCKVNATCSAGTCVGVDIQCPDDANPCTTAACVPGVGCRQQFNTNPCSDGNPCTVNDQCSLGSCQGAAKDCSDSNECTDDFCNVTTGACYHQNNANTCDDGSVCTLNDVCSGGSCVPGTVNQVCNDTNPCTDDSCDSSGGCIYTPVVNRSCWLNDPCVSNEKCSATGVCEGIPRVCPEDNDVCTTAVCNSGVGCGFINNTASCDDNDPCTVNDQCNQGVCAGVAKTCDDSNFCTDDMCHPSTGQCMHTNNTKSCNDNNMCTVNDTCTGGVCTGPPLACDSCEECNAVQGCSLKNTFCKIDSVCRSHGETHPAGHMCLSCDGNANLPRASWTTAASSCFINNTCVAHNTFDPARSCFKCDSAANQADWTLETNSCFINGQCYPHSTIDPARSCYSCDTAKSTTSWSLISNNCFINGQCYAQSTTDPTRSCYACDTARSSSSWSLNASNCFINGQCYAQAATDPSRTCFACDTDQSSNAWSLSSAQCFIDSQCYADTMVHPNRTCYTCAAGTSTSSWTLSAGTCFIDGVCYNNGATNLAKPCQVCNTAMSTAQWSLAANTCHIDGQCYADGAMRNGNDPCALCSPAQPYVWSYTTVSCDDNNACTLSDTCTSGLCVGTPKDCSDGNFCTDDTCNNVTGACSHTFHSRACDDGNACTSNDVCDGAGTCIGQTTTVCDDGNSCTDDSCHPTLGCQYTANNSHSCTTSSLCKQNPRCVGGTCVTDDVTCPHNGDSCMVPACNPTSGCYNVYAPDDRSCDDINLCTTDDKCVPNTGICRGAPKSCDDSNACTTDTCDPITGQCQHENLNTEKECDGNTCTLRDNCVNGVCQPGAPRECTSSNPCKYGWCQAYSTWSTCRFSNNNSGVCTLGSACSTADVCSNGLCVASNSSCEQDSNPCTEHYCTDSGCKARHLNYVPCDDGNACTNGDYCLWGACRGGSNKNCNDGDTCTNDVCNTTSGQCVIANNTGATCSTSNKCITSSTCDNGQCTGGVPVTCPVQQSYHDACRTWTCDPATGCQYSSAREGLNCTDFSVCTVNDTCSNGLCVGVDVTSSCPDDGDQCTDKKCHPVTGCYHQRHWRSCDDGFPCTINDRCVFGQCIGTNKTCTGDQCYAHTCEWSTGICKSTPLNGTACEDGNPCTTGDFCVHGKCITGPGRYVCPDDNPCAFNPTCDPGLNPSQPCRYSFRNVTTQCDDGNSCTSNDRCNGAGKCTGVLNDCSGHGRCYGGNCFCSSVPEGRFSGPTCADIELRPVFDFVNVSTQSVPTGDVAVHLFEGIRTVFASPSVVGTPPISWTVSISPRPLGPTIEYNSSTGEVVWDLPISLTRTYTLTYTASNRVGRSVSSFKVWVPPGYNVSAEVSSPVVAFDYVSSAGGNKVELTVTGIATNSVGDRLANKEVLVWLYYKNIYKFYTAQTNIAGRYYHTVYTRDIPIHGRYGVGAVHPGRRSDQRGGSGEQASFQVMGFRLHPRYLVISAVSGDVNTWTTNLMNLGDQALTGLHVSNALAFDSPVTSIHVGLPSVVDGQDDQDINITITTAVTEVISNQVVQVNVLSAEGAAAFVLLSIKVEPRQVKWLVTPSVVKTGVLRGNISLADFVLKNVGSLDATNARVCSAGKCCCVADELILFFMFLLRFLFVPFRLCCPNR